jgi:hypothetical protein
VQVVEHDICAPDALLVIGQNPESLRDRVAQIRKDAHPIVAGDAPRRALRALVHEGDNPAVGGAVQYGWASRGGFELVADVVPIPRLPSGRNAASLVLGFDVLDLPTIAGHIIGITGRV